MATDPDMQDSEETSAPKPARSRKRSTRAANKNGASASQPEHSSNGALDDVHIPPPADDDTPTSPMTRMTVPPPPGGYVSPNPSVQAAAPAPVYTPPPASPPVQPTRRGGGFGRFMVRLFGWLLAALFGVAIGLLIFALAPVGFKQVIAPVTQNTEDITNLNHQMGDLSSQIG